MDEDQEDQGIPHSDRATYIGLVVAVLLIAAAAALFVRVKPKPTPAQTQAEAPDQKAIAAVKLRYEPGSRLLNVNPDPHPAWKAVKFPYCVDKTADCWLVGSQTEVMSMSETQILFAEWIVDLKSQTVWPRNAEARQMFTAMPDPTTHTGEAEKISYWAARSESAQKITGDIQSTPRSMTISGTRMPVTLVRKLGYDEVIDAATMFSREVTPDSIGGLYRMGTVSSGLVAHPNPMCGEQETVWVIALITRANGPDYGQELQLAAFSSAPEPEFKPGSKTAAPCGVFGYQKSTGAAGPTK